LFKTLPTQTASFSTVLMEEGRSPVENATIDSILKSANPIYLSYF
jgi:hypothetical protein